MGERARNAGRAVRSFGNFLIDPPPAPSYTGQVDAAMVEAPFRAIKEYGFDPYLELPGVYADQAKDFYSGLTETPAAAGAPESASPAAPDTPNVPVPLIPTSPAQPDFHPDRYRPVGQMSVWTPPASAPLASPKQAEPVGPPEFAKPPVQTPTSAPEFAKITTYADQVNRNLDQPFMPKYNSLRYGKPLMFDGSDDRVKTETPRMVLGRDMSGMAIEGAGVMEITDRPMSLGELNPMDVQQQDWGKYLEATAKAMSTKDFDASKDPEVLQQLQVMNAAYWKFQASKKEERLLAQRRKLLEMEQRDMEYRAGLRSAEAGEMEDFQTKQAETKADFLRKQAKALRNQSWNSSDGYSDEDVKRADEQAARLEAEADQIQSTSTEEVSRGREQAAVEDSLWWRDQISKLRSSYVTLDEHQADTQMTRDMATQEAALGHMMMGAVGQSREAMLQQRKAQQEAAQQRVINSMDKAQLNKVLAVQNARIRELALQADTAKDELKDYDQMADGSWMRKSTMQILEPAEAKHVQSLRDKLARAAQEHQKILHNQYLMLQTGTVMPQEEEPVPPVATPDAGQPLQVPDLSQFIRK